MKIEKAGLNGKLIGWRITHDEQTVLIWNDDPLLPGIRLGKGFVPGIGKVIDYTEQGLLDKGGKG